ncbi:uncharacterized protein LOC116179317 [Photinus pyralis]|uniref:uncharacterized protein LOC116160381 n=1 Tax=Photinus pyralis TaxID=7054 RepID=UPI001266FB85|nr:uncharacterized protein LOC116160381 [Photinus pyralis]XP_031354946.1 uncharacterized protein LOC116179317 [Photinus pyralis]
MEMLLTHWGLESLIGVFQENCIDESVLLKLKERDIEKLVPQIGLRLKLTENLEIWKTIKLAEIELDTGVSEAEPRSEDLSTISLESGNPDAASSIIFFDNGESTTQEQKRDLNSILNCNEGRELLQTYALQKIVKRRALVKLIIDDELRNNPDKRIERDRFVYLAQEIQRTFPTENAGIYYVQGYRDMEGKAVGNHGKLWDKYINTRRKYRSLDIIPSTPAKKTKPNQPNPSVIEEGAEESASWLEYNNAPFTTVQEHWKKSHSFRFATNITSGISIFDYFEKFIALKLPTGILLLEDDFNRLHPDKKDKLFEHWTNISEAIIVLAKRKNCPLIKQLIESINNLDSASYRVKEHLSLLLFPLIFPNIYRKIKGKQTPNFSKIEIKDSFILHIKEEADYAQILEAREQKCVRLKLTEQPSAIIVGDIEQPIKYLVKINAHVYEVESLLKALDLCFKACFALNAKYPVESQQCFTYIQKHIYGIHTEFDVNFVAVSSVKSDLDAILIDSTT